MGQATAKNCGYCEPYLYNDKVETTFTERIHMPGCCISYMLVSEWTYALTP